MNELKLITPVSGQTNWGNAINSNFTLLLEKYKSVLAGYQRLNDRLEELDTLKIKQDHFIYIVNNEAYLNRIVNWDGKESFTSTKMDFSSDDYINYDAWFVKIDNDSDGENYKNALWHTGDLLILYKNNSADYSIEQWTGIMGGYYEPREINIVDDKLQTTYEKRPSFSSQKVKTINAPLIHWKPTGHEDGKFIYKAYNGNAAINGLGLQKIGVPITTVATVYSYTSTFQDVVIDNTVSIENIFTETSPETTADNLGCQITWTDRVGNILYFPYYIYREGNTLQIYFTSHPSKYTGDVIMKVSIFK